jgi:MFS transporter, ceroid-lipofuscinosis neuronal protein 7
MRPLCVQIDSQPSRFVLSCFLLPLHDMYGSIFRLNMYTAPAYFMGGVVSITIILILVYFRDRVKIHTSKDSKRKSAKRASIDDHANQTTFVGLTVYDCCILGCMLLNVSTKGSIGSFETLGINIAEIQFNMTSATAGTIVASCGTIGVAALLSMGYLATFFNDIQLICGGMVIMCCGILNLAFLDDTSSNPSWKFILAIFLVYSIGYPIGHTAVIGLFSKSEFCNYEFWTSVFVFRLTLILKSFG